MAALVGAFASASWFSFRSAGADSEVRSLAKRIVSLLGLNEGANGMNCDAADSDLRLSSLIGELLNESPENINRLASLSDADLRRRIRRNIISDFEAGRLSSVDGWVLSKTETHALNLRDRLHGVADV